MVGWELSQQWIGGRPGRLLPTIANCDATIFIPSTSAYSTEITCFVYNSHFCLCGGQLQVWWTNLGYQCSTKDRLYNRCKKLVFIIENIHFEEVSLLITSEAEGRASSTENKGKSWVWAAGPPAVVTLLRGSYLWNRKPDWQAVFFGGYPPSLLPCKGPMPNHASTHYGTWRVLPGGCHKCSACCFSVTTGPIALKFGMQLGTH